MRRTLTIAATVLCAIGLAAPAAQASTVKFTFENVTFSDGTTGIVYASVKTHKTKSDNVACSYQTTDWQSLGYYLEFLEPAPSDPEAVLQICLDGFDERQT